MSDDKVLSAIDLAESECSAWLGEVAVNGSVSGAANARMHRMFQAIRDSLVERDGEPVSDASRPMDTYVSWLALLWMPEFDHYAAGWWKGSVISGITRLQTPLVQDDKQLWLEMTDMQPLGWMPLPAAPGASHD